MKLILLLLILIYLFLLKGRSGHQGLENFLHHTYAHRGLYGGNVPENSLTAFERAFEAGYGIEFDLHLLKDGNIGILHDSSLKRMTGKEGILENLTTEDLKNYHLNNTEQTIPTLHQVLGLCGGRAPLIIELKSFGGNAPQLTEAACRQLQDYEGPYCLESFDPRCIRWLKQNRPQLIRGQLSENFFKNKASRLPALIKFMASYHLETFLSKPDFIAHKYRDRKNLSTFLIRRLWKIQGVTWTVQTQQELDQALSEGWIPIFEGFLPPPNP